MDKMIFMNVSYWLFLGLTAYFVTPHILWLLLAIQGFQNSEDDKELSELVLELEKLKKENNANA